MSRSAPAPHHAIEPLEPRQLLATFTVTSNDDAGAGSLRQAVEDANAAEGADVIEFDESLTGETITLSSGELLITDDLTISGLGMEALTIDAQGTSRHFDITDSAFGTLLRITISDLRITGGSADNGGAIRNSDALTLRDVRLDGNSATEDGGAILNRATLVLDRVTLTDNSAGAVGGAISTEFNSPTTISDSLFENNTSGGDGGAIDHVGGAIAGGGLTIDGTRFSGNTSGANGGAMSCAGAITLNDNQFDSNTADEAGGAIFNRTGGTLSSTADLFESNSAPLGGAVESLGAATFSQTELKDNSAAEAGGAIDNNGGTLTINRSTLNGNTTQGSGGAIWTDGSLTISNSTISGNTAAGWGGGIGMFDGTVIINNSTIAFNTADTDGDGQGQGGGIDVGRRDGAGTLTTTSTIYAGNTRGAAASVLDDISLTDGTVSGSNNLVEDPATAGGLTDGENGNIVGEDPLLGDLADNDGPTLTHAIYPRSPAFNAGTTSGGASTDQRGKSRTHGENTDIGAVEWQPTPFPRQTVFLQPATAGSQTGDTNSVATRNINGDLVVFRESGDGWIVESLADHTGAEGPFGASLIWTDPGDGLIYVAGYSDDGVLLFQRSESGAWSYRNLSTELGVPDDMPSERFTQFVTTDGLVSVAGYSDAGELVLLQQTGDTGSEGALWSFRNLSDDLASRGMTTPDLADITSYVTPWNQWTIAGIDVDGDVQGVWVFVPNFTTWRVDNLSALYGTPTLTGQLTVIQTSWSAINLAGTDADGNVIVTWWIPRFGGAWAVNDLTSEQGGAPLADGRITGFVTPWGAMNYAGLDADGEVVAYWWTPSTRWSVSSLTGNIETETRRPISALNNHVSTAGTMNIVGTDDTGHVLRLWWTPNDDGKWKLTDLTDVAARA